MSTVNHHSPNVFASFDPPGQQAALTSLCSELFDQQRSTWRKMAEGVASLESVRTREIICNGFSVHLQFNPKRIASTGADVDPAVIRRRPCFLCPESLPEEQQGILYRSEYYILCNPLPIFHRHFTISSVHHVPQDFESSVDVMLDLARDLGPEYSVFYNGPQSGASAPDHLHFQSSPRLAIPVERDAVDVRRRKRFYYKNHVAGFTLMDYGRTVVIIESSDNRRLAAYIGRLLAGWKEHLRLAEEPMMNVLCSYQENIWRLILFPRRKHRPDVYFKDGDARILISPATVDMGGLIVTPLEKDFLRVQTKLVEDIFVEVSEGRELVDQILENIE
ncbi:MAG: DUF4922 domain-containing protein [Ignavibacteriae bacterium]|nr:MAG: DUF4922 domain-containing protein [Ignavibacteriota bacterium]